MNPNPKSARIKIAFTGTNSSGKTTMALEVTSRLKSQHHVLAEVVSSQDRKITWKDDHFPVDPRAHYGMITNLIHAEVQAELKGDADVVITDRSVLDLYAIALTDHPDSILIKALGHTVNAWATTYTKIFYLPPLPYQEDGKRPPDAFRMRTHATLLKLIDTGTYPNVEVHVQRSDIFKSVCEVVGVKSSNPLILGETHKLQMLANAVNCPLYVKPRDRESSDLDIWYEIESLRDLNPETDTYSLFGPHINVQLMAIPKAAVPELLLVHPNLVCYEVGS